MKLKTVLVPRGYDGLHLEVDGAIINVYVGLHDDQGRCVTNITTIPDADRYAGEQGWFPRDNEGRVISAACIRLVQETPEEYRARVEHERGVYFAGRGMRS